MRTAAVRHVAIVAPQFPPCNLAAVHRSRLFAQHLAEFGYEPTILSVDPAYYEGPLDRELERLVPDHVRVVRTRALPTRPVRLVGDVGLRSFWFQYRALRRLAAAGAVDLLYLPIPPNYSSLLGPLLKRRFRIPYVIDYIDPWVYPITDDERRSWKARASHRLARWLEPLAVAGADGITGVAPGYFAGVLERHPHLRDVPTAAIPYGGEEADHDFIRRSGRASRVLQAAGLSGKQVLAYAGAFLPRAADTLRALFGAARQLRLARPDLAARLHLLFVGTGARPGDPASGLVAPVAAEMGVRDLVTEVADRQPYLEVLALLHRAHGAMILGSSERHYTASKTFQALHSGRPVLALLHEESTAAAMLRGVAGVELVTFNDTAPVGRRVGAAADALGRLLARPADRALSRDSRCLEPYSAREMTRRLAACFEDVLARTKRSPALASRAGGLL
jgi:glycosyltransferase involved in cell wall biosynthesis